MNPEQGQLVQVRFNNGTFFDAIVESWSDQKSVVKMVDSEDLIIIQKTLQDVLAVKIVVVKKPAEPIEESLESDTPTMSANEVNDEFSYLRDEPITPYNLKRMAELKDEMNKLDREAAFKKLRTFEATGVRSVQYGIPRNIQVGSTTQHTEQEATSADSGFYSEVQGLFNKKY